MDNNEIKKSPIKNFIDNINANKNMFITRIKILKQLKANGNDVNIDTIQKVFNVNIINTNSTSKKEKSSSSKSDKTDKKKLKKDKETTDLNSFSNSTKEDNEKTPSSKKLLNKKKLTSSFCLVLVLLANFVVSTLLFNTNDSIKFNELTEQLNAIIHRTIESPQTDISLKSKYDKKTNSIIYYYEIIDNLDSYSYYVKNTSLDEELRVKLLEKIANNTKKIKNIKSIDLTSINSISLVEQSYIINNKFSIDEENITGKDISLITSSIKDNNIKQYNNNKQNFIIASYTTLLILEGFVVFITYKNKNKKTQ